MPPSVRNSYLQKKTIQTGISNVEIKVPKLRWYQRQWNMVKQLIATELS
ncbi:MAG: hypothetical protein ACTS73_02910 [Arsenophonus sp. NEOnobi-MAG3]